MDSCASGIVGMAAPAEMQGPLLMVDPVGDQIFPVSPRALAAVETPTSRVLARNCVALFLDAEGGVRRITDVRIAGGPAARLGVLFGMAASARFSMEPVDVPLGDFRQMILDAISISRHRDGAGPENRWLTSVSGNEIRAALEGADSLAKMHAAIRFPADEDCVGRL